MVLERSTGGIIDNSGVRYGAVPKIVRVAGPATYATGGVPVDLSATFSQILAVHFLRQVITATGVTESSATSTHVGAANETGTDLFSSAKFRLMLFRGNYTPAGTISAPTITTTGSAGLATLSIQAGALNDNSGAGSGITGVQAPTFTGTNSVATLQEATNGSTPTLNHSYDVMVWGVPL